MMRKKMQMFSYMRHAYGKVLLIQLYLFFFFTMSVSSKSLFSSVPVDSIHNETKGETLVGSRAVTSILPRERQMTFIMFCSIWLLLKETLEIWVCKAAPHNLGVVDVVPSMYSKNSGTYNRMHKSINLVTANIYTINNVHYSVL